MRGLIRSTILHTPLYRPIRNLLDRRRDEKAMQEWRKAGCPIPPPHRVKQAVLRQYARRYRLTVLVETGTYYGDMVNAMTYAFRQIYSIELSEDLFKRAQKRFGDKAHIELICGDSAKVLPSVLNQLSEPALFWLDGHYSGGPTARGAEDTPILAELDQILAMPDIGHVIVVDDARCFGADAAYPTLEALKEYVLARRPNVRYAVEGDSIRIAPGR